MLAVVDQREEGLKDASGFARDEPYKWLWPIDRGPAAEAALSPG